MRATGPGNEWSGDITFQINSRVGVTTNGFLNFTTSMAGSGSLVKEDTGTLRFSGFDLSAFSGNILINEGEFQLNHAFVPATIPANLAGIPGIDFHTFSGADIVRHPLVAKIIEAYEAYRNPIAGENGKDKR
mgnify:CR=1 FL=1